MILSNPVSSVVAVECSSYISFSRYSISKSCSWSSRHVSISISSSSSSSNSSSSSSRSSIF